MAGQVVPFDPYEERRRRLLGQGQPPSPQEQEYLRVLAQQPTRGEHQPGMLRKLLGAAAGGSTGWQSGATAGIEAARHVTDLPYERATGDWKERLQAAMAPVELGRAGRAEGLDVEKVIQGERGLVGQEAETEARRPYWSGMGAAAQRRADEPFTVPPGYGAFRPGEQEPFHTQPFQPAAPQRPMILGQGQQAFTPGGERIAGVEPRPMATPLTFEQRRQLARVPAEATAELRVRPPVKMDEFSVARQEATMKVMLNHPEWEDFVDWEGGVPEIQQRESGQDADLYNMMLSAIDDEMRRIAPHAIAEDRYNLEKED